MTGVRLMNVAALAALLVATVLLVSAAARWVAQRPAFEFKRIEVRGDLQHVTAHRFLSGWLLQYRTRRCRAALGMRCHDRGISSLLQDARQ